MYFSKEFRDSPLYVNIKPWICQQRNAEMYKIILYRNIKTQAFLNMFTCRETFKFREFVISLDFRGTCLYVLRLYNETLYVQTWILESFLEIYSSKMCLWHMSYSFLCSLLVESFLLCTCKKRKCRKCKNLQDAC